MLPLSINAQYLAVAAINVVGVLWNVNDGLIGPSSSVVSHALLGSLHAVCLVCLWRKYRGR